MIDNYVESQFDKYMFDRNIYAIRHIDETIACRIMGITPAQLKVYLAEEYGGTFAEAVNKCRISESKDIWSQCGTTPIRRVAKKVGYGNALLFLWYFWKYERCLPYVWKKRMLITL